MANKAKKVTKNELKSVQEKVNQINTAQMHVGGLHIQACLAVENVKNLQKELNIIQNSMESKYGKVSVNLTDGSLKDLPEIPKIDGSHN
jgi:hypothetical protein